MVILSFFNEIYNFVVKYSSINKRNTNMIKALLCFFVADKNESLEIIDSLKVREQKFKTCEGKILRLEQIEQFCISKNMALILYVLRMRPYF